MDKLQKIPVLIDRFHIHLCMETEPVTNNYIEVYRYNYENIGFCCPSCGHQFSLSENILFGYSSPPPWRALTCPRCNDFVAQLEFEEISQKELGLYKKMLE